MRSASDSKARPAVLWRVGEGPHSSSGTGEVCEAPKGQELFTGGT